MRITPTTTMNRFPAFLLYAASLLLVTTGFQVAQARPADASGSSSSLLGSWTSWLSSGHSNRTHSNEWFAIDPSTLLETLVTRGGLFLPDYIDGDLSIMRRAMHCQKASLNLFKKQMVLTNFTIGIRNKPYLLRVGRTAVRWNSYQDPVLFIEVDDVDVMVEFTNLLLTQNNWQKLAAMGFPPLFEDPKLNVTSSYNSSYYDSWIRFGSIDVSGNVTLRISSKPLDKDLGVLTYDMKALQPISQEMKKQSGIRYTDTGRLGLTVTDLSHVLQSFFVQQAKEYVLTHFQQILATNPKEAMRSGVDRALAKASEAILGYATEASEKYTRDMTEVAQESSWGVKLKGWFAKVDQTVDRLLSTNETLAIDNTSAAISD